MKYSINMSLCRLCLCSGCRLTDIFGENNNVEFTVENIIEDLLRLKVARERKYPWLVCSNCLAKLTEFRLFKLRCLECLLVFSNRVQKDDCAENKGWNRNIEKECPENARKADACSEMHHVDGNISTGDPLFVPSDMSGMTVEDVGGVIAVDSIDIVEHMVPKSEADPFGDGDPGFGVGAVDGVEGRNAIHINEKAINLDRGLDENSHRECDVNIKIEAHDSDIDHEECPGNAINDYGHRSVSSYGGNNAVGVTVEDVEGVSALVSLDIVEHIVPKCEPESFGDGDAGTNVSGVGGVEGSERVRVDSNVDGITFDVPKVNEDNAQVDEPRTSTSEINDASPPPLLLKSRVVCAGESFKCDLCRTKFRAINSLSIVNPFHCNVCKEKLKSNDQVASLQRMNTGRMRYVCRICSRKFTQKGNLSTHMRTHTGERPFICDLCERSFAQKSHLVSHMRTHTGDKPFECSLCGRCFSNNSNLRKHKLTHKGGKNFECSKCTRKFTNNGNLATHMRTHGSKWPFKCDLCKKSFTNTTNMATHMRSHSGEKPYECSSCGKRFADSGAKWRHSLTHAKVK